MAGAKRWTTPFRDGTGHPANAPKLQTARQLQISSRGLARGFAARTGRQRAGSLTLRHPIGRQLDLPSIREFEIPHMHVAAATFDDIARADRKSARETTDPGTHGPLSCLTTGPPTTKKIARERDGSETPLCEALIPVGKCGQG